MSNAIAPMLVPLCKNTVTFYIRNPRVGYPQTMLTDYWPFLTPLIHSFILND